MHLRVLFTIVLLALLLTGCQLLAQATETVPSSATLSLPADLQRARVTRVVDGDTVDVRLAGETIRVRLIGVNSPESVDPRRPVECFGREASRQLAAWVDGRNVLLEADRSQGNRDRFGRLLRYIWLPDGSNINLALIAEGYAFEYTFDTPYRYQTEFRQAQRTAERQQRGLWSPATCGGRADVPAAIPPLTPQQAATATPAIGAGCDPAYPDVCIPPPPPDLNCRDIPYRRFRVLPPDPHQFDGNGDGVACETD